MKKWVWLGMVMISMLAVVAGNARADESHYTYTVSGGMATITVYSGPGGDIIIPNRLGGHFVVAIGNGVFTYRSWSPLTSVVIPDSVTSIGNNAFKDGIALESVTIGNNVEIIGPAAFYGCSSLPSVVIPDSVHTIGGSAFRECTALESVTIGNNVQTIGFWAFSGCTSLKSVLIPDSVTYVGDHAFLNCTSLESVTIGNNVEIIGVDAFRNCTSLTSVVIPGSVQTIWTFAFKDCSALESVTIGNGVETIMREAFFGCNSLTSVVIPDSVTSIGDLAFYGCTSLESVAIGNSVQTIGISAFVDSSLTSLVIPGSVTSIDDWAFAFCSELNNVYFLGDAPSHGQNVFLGLSNVTIYYNPETEGWGNTWGGMPTSPIEDPDYPTLHTVTLHRGDYGQIANADSGGTYTVTVICGSGFPAVNVTPSAGFVFAGWSPDAPDVIEEPFEAVARYRPDANVIAMATDEIRDSVEAQNEHGLYTPERLRHLFPTPLMIAVDPQTGEVSLDLQMQRSNDLSEWQTHGEPIRWTDTETGDKAFYRLIFNPVDE